MTIVPEEIPDEVAIIADEAYYNTPMTMPDRMIMKTAIAAAINAWPGIGKVEGLMDGTDMVAPPAIFLPLTQENENG